MLSLDNIRIRMIDLARLRNDGIIPEIEAEDIVGVNLIHEPEKIERAQELFRKYSAMPSKSAQKAAARIRTS